MLRSPLRSLSFGKTRYARGPLSGPYRAPLALGWRDPNFPVGLLAVPHDQIGIPARRRVLEGHHEARVGDHHGRAPLLARLAQEVGGRTGEAVEREGDR